MNTLQHSGGGYDYAALDSPTAALAQQAAGEIKEKVRRAAQDIIDIGNRLLDVKAALPHGAFTGWLDAEFGWGERQARRFMNVAEAFKTDNLSDLQIAPSALYALAAPSTPAEAREELLQQARNGQPVSNKDAQASIARHKAAQQHEPGGGAVLDTGGPDLDSLLLDIEAQQPDIDSLLADTSGPAAILHDMEALQEDTALDEGQPRREPPQPGYMRVRVVTGSYEDAERATELLQQALGSGKYTAPREANQPKYAGSYRVYSREDVQMGRIAAPSQADEQQPVDTALPMEVAAYRARIAILEGENERLRAEAAATQRELNRAYDSLAKQAGQPGQQGELQQARKEIANLHRANEAEVKEAQQAIARLQDELQAARGLAGEARSILEEYRLPVSKAQQYKPTSARGEAVSPLLRCIERVWILLQKKP